MPQVSIILTTHNGRKEVCQRAIKSVLNQTFDDWELIVVDDASHDGTDEMVKSFQDPRIRYIHRDKNWGNDTRPKNEGVRAATAPYIAFLDSDNVYRPDHLAILFKAIQDNPKASLVYGDRWAIYDDKSEPDRIGFTADFNAANLLIKNYIDTSDVLLKKEDMYAVGGWDERYSKYVDWNMWLRMAKSGQIFLRVPTIITDYHINPTAKSKSVITKKEDEFIKKVRGKIKPPNIPDWDPFDLEIHLPYLGEVKPPKVAIYTLTHDRLEYTKRTFESLRETAGYPYEHYIFDNGSTDGTVEWLKEYQKDNDNVHVVYSDDNRGISIASNWIVDEIKKTDANIIMKLDNDCLLLTHRWLQKMVEIWKSNHMIALSCYVQGLRDNPGGAPRIRYGQIKGELVGMTRHLGGICHFVDRRAYTLFRWPEDDFLHGMQDLEFSQYLYSNGFQMCYLENYFCEHMEGTDGQHKRYPEYFKRRTLEKTNRYKIMPLDETHP